MMTHVMREYQSRIESSLDQAFCKIDAPARLLESMRYSTLSSGKRVRALLVYGAGVALDAPMTRLDAVASALECIHAYSLIHDDLPAMDDDDLRRGKPTNHIEFDEATAILAGDALQALAFELISDSASNLSDSQVRAITQKLAGSSGAAGMVGGQVLDILATEKSISHQALENVHKRKTGALINAAVVCGALCSDGVTPDQLRSLGGYADHLGLAFQVVDDVLDIESSTEQLGKPSGADVELGKSTYPALIGLAESKQLATNLYHRAIDCIHTISDNSELSKDNLSDKTPNKFSLLHDIAELIVTRTH